MIVILAGAGPAFGTGHAERMRALRDILSKKHKVELILSHQPDRERANGLLAQADLVILDARDIDPDVGRPAIALDNRFSGRTNSRAVFHDTIPHPHANFEGVMQNCLIHPDLINARKGASDAGQTGSLFVYTGEARPPRLSVDRRVVQAGRVRIAGADGSERMERDLFVKSLSASAAALSYFGMTVLEAMFLGLPTATYGIGSAVHDLLSVFLEEKAGVPFYGEGMVVGNEVFERLPRLRPTGEGYSVLVDLIEGLL